MNNIPQEHNISLNIYTLGILWILHENKMFLKIKCHIYVPPYWLIELDASPSNWRSRRNLIKQDMHRSVKAILSANPSAAS